MFAAALSSLIICLVFLVFILFCVRIWGFCLCLALEYPVCCVFGLFMPMCILPFGLCFEFLISFLYAYLLPAHISCHTLRPWQNTSPNRPHVHHAHYASASLVDAEPWHSMMVWIFHLMVFFYIPIHIILPNDWLSLRLWIGYGWGAWSADSQDQHCSGPHTSYPCMKDPMNFGAILL